MCRNTLHVFQAVSWENFRFFQQSKNFNRYHCSYTFSAFPVIMNSTFVIQTNPEIVQDKTVIHFPIQRKNITEVDFFKYGLKVVLLCKSFYALNYFNILSFGIYNQREFQSLYLNETGQFVFCIYPDLQQMFQH